MVASVIPDAVILRAAATILYDRSVDKNSRFLNAWLLSIRAIADEIEEEALKGQAREP